MVAICGYPNIHCTLQSADSKKGSCCYGFMRSRSDEVARQRQELPWVPINKGYRFETDEGSASLADLFRGRSQLLVYHFMFGPDYAAGCPSCSMIADGFEGFAVHLANHDVMLWAVSRAPLPKLQGYKRRMGWTFPWASSFGGDFNFDFSVGFTEEQQSKEGIEYNYRREKVFHRRRIRQVAARLRRTGHGGYHCRTARTQRRARRASHGDCRGRRRFFRCICCPQVEPPKTVAP